jgi:transposase
MPGESVAIVVTAQQRRLLEGLVRAKSTAQQLAERCQIVLMSAEGRRNQHQADALGVDRQRVRRWRHRWHGAQDTLAAAEQESATDKDLQALSIRVLTDNDRSGTPPKFSPEQLASIIALACEPPAESGLPVSHWTPAELAREAIKRGVVENISPRQVDRFLARRSFDRTRASIG